MRLCMCAAVYCAACTLHGRLLCADSAGGGLADTGCWECICVLFVLGSWTALVVAQEEDMGGVWGGVWGWVGSYDPPRPPKDAVQGAGTRLPQAGALRLTHPPPSPPPLPPIIKHPPSSSTPTLALTPHRRCSRGWAPTTSRWCPPSPSPLPRTRRLRSCWALRSASRTERPWTLDGPWTAGEARGTGERGRAGSQPAACTTAAAGELCGGGGGPVRTARCACCGRPSLLPAPARPWLLLLPLARRHWRRSMGADLHTGSPTD